MRDLKKGDRVVVMLSRDENGPTRFIGSIIGESRFDGHAWLIIKDGTKYPRAIHKSFCKPLEIDHA